MLENPHRICITRSCLQWGSITLRTLAEPQRKLGRGRFLELKRMVLDPNYLLTIASQVQIFDGGMSFSRKS